MVAIVTRRRKLSGYVPQVMGSHMLAHVPLLYHSSKGLVLDQADGGSPVAVSAFGVLTSTKVALMWALDSSH
jgi:hypothetical protein